MRRINGTMDLRFFLLFFFFGLLISFNEINYIIDGKIAFDELFFFIFSRRFKEK